MHGNFTSFRNTYSTFSITDCKKQIIRSIEQPNRMVIERRSVTSRCRGSKIFGSQQYFLDRDGRSFALSNDAQRYGLPFCSLVQSCTGKSNVIFSVVFVFLPYLKDHSFVEIQKFCYHVNVTSRLLLSIS